VLVSFGFLSKVLGDLMGAFCFASNKPQILWEPFAGINKLLHLCFDMPKILMNKPNHPLKKIRANLSQKDFAVYLTEQTCLKWSASMVGNYESLVHVYPTLHRMMELEKLYDLKPGEMRIKINRHISEMKKFKASLN